MSDTTKLQFRVLYRQFLFRMVDLELLSASAQGDVSKLLGQFAALLTFFSLVLAIAALLFMGADIPPHQLLARTLALEHFLIATTMLVVGLFAVLSWDSTFPNRLDVMVLAPLPVRSRTLFFAKVAALATALGLTVGCLHIPAGLAWPFALAKRAIPYSVSVLTYDPPLAPVNAADLKAVLDQDLARGSTPGISAFAPGTGLGASIGVWRQGTRRVFTYGAAKPDSLFDIGSITKTFTGLVLAQMVAQGKVKLDEPVRELLPEKRVPKPSGEEITLLDLATHHSGLPSIPANFQDASRAGTYSKDDMYDYLEKHRVSKRANTPFVYSNFGFGLLGTALAERAGTSYPELMKQNVTGPLGLRDTTASLFPEQVNRLMPGYDVQNRPTQGIHLDQGSLAPSGSLKSTAIDMLAYLEAQLHPEKLASTLPDAILESHKLRANADSGASIALAWNFDPATGTYSHGGTAPGYTALALFNPKDDYAAIFLLNSGPPGVPGLLGEHIGQRLAGLPAISLASMRVSGSGGILGALRTFAAYWVTMVLAGAFTFCCVLGLQGLAAQVLPRRSFLRVSSFLQLAAFCLFVTLYFLEPSPAGLLVAGADLGGLSWLPSYWFLGLFQQLNGSVWLAQFAARAWIGLSIAVGGTAVAYLLSYLRTLRKIVEEPDIVASARGLHWLPRFGNSLQTAVVQFSIRSLLRSRQHRIILAFYLGFGFAVLILLLQNPGPKGQVTSQVDIRWLFSTVMMMCVAVVGMRVVFSIPLAPRSNWIFRLTQVRGPRDYLVAIRRPLFVLAVVPVWTVSAVFLLWNWPWRHSLGHLVVLWLVGMLVGYLCLQGFQKIPFTCSYLPGKSYFHMSALAALALIVILIPSVVFEAKALEDPASYAKMLGVLIVAVIAARWRAIALAKSDEAVVQFEDERVPAIQLLGLNRDGVVPIANH